MKNFHIKAESQMYSCHRIYFGVGISDGVDSSVLIACVYAVTIWINYTTLDVIPVTAMMKIEGVSHGPPSTERDAEGSGSSGDDECNSDNVTNSINSGKCDDVSGDTATPVRRRKRRTGKRVKKTSVVHDQTEGGRLLRARAPRKVKSANSVTNGSSISRSGSLRRSANYTTTRNRNSRKDGSDNDNIPNMVANRKLVNSSGSNTCVEPHHTIQRANSAKYNSRSPIVFLQKDVARLSSRQQEEVGNREHGLSTVSEDIVNIPHKGTNSATRANSRYREQTTGQKCAHRYLEDTFSARLKLSNRSLGEHIQSPGDQGAPMFDQGKRKSVNVSTLSFGDSLKLSTAKDNPGDNFLTLKYAQTSTQKYPVCQNDMFMKNGVFDPVEYLVHGRISNRNKELGMLNIGREGSGTISPCKPPSKAVPKPILKTTAEQTSQSMFSTAATPKCVRFAFPESNSGNC